MTDEDGNLKIIDLGMVYEVNTEVKPCGSTIFVSPLKYTML